MDNGDSITINGMQQGWTFEVKSATQFNAVQVDAAAGTSTFKLGVFSYGETSYGSPVDLSYDIVATDRDGDSVTGHIGATLYPAVPTIAGTSGNDILAGTMPTITCSATVATIP